MVTRIPDITTKLSFSLIRNETNIFRTEKVILRTFDKKSYKDGRLSNAMKCQMINAHCTRNINFGEENS